MKMMYYCEQHYNESSKAYCSCSTHQLHSSQQIANGKVDFKKRLWYPLRNGAKSFTNTLSQLDQAIGVRSYPPADSEHYKLLKLVKFVVSPYTKDDNKSTSSNILHSWMTWYALDPPSLIYVIVEAWWKHIIHADLLHICRSDRR